MRKLFLMISAMLVSVIAVAEVEIELFVSIDDETPLGHNVPKTPVRPPHISIENGVLSFTADHPEYNLIIKDENGDEVYQTIVPSAEVQAVLPTFLSGDYQIELIMGIWKFSGYISI
ncbi:MAG: hypothetical protein IJ614_04780 [Prevotella sp.]|nr:hypothetical protein [Prevotella sp.]